MALRILKKFDELDMKEKEMAGRRGKHKPFAKNIGKSRPKSSRQSYTKSKKKTSRRPQSAGVMGRRGASIVSTRKQQVHVSPSNKPLAPEVDNVFKYTGEDVVLNRDKNNIFSSKSKHLDNGGRKKRARPASAGLVRRRISNGTFNDNKNTTYGCWNRNKLQRGKKYTGTFGGGRSMAGASIVSLAKRIIKPEFYFLRICLKGITKKYKFKIS